jgi:hypothetical protein
MNGVSVARPSHRSALWSATFALITTLQHSRSTTVKRILIIFLVAASLIGIGWGGYMWSQREVDVHSHPLEAVMPDALLIFEFHALTDAVIPLKVAGYAETLMQSDILSATLTRLMLLDSVLQTHSLVLGKLNGLQAVTSGDEGGLLTVLQTPSDLRSAELKSLLDEVTGLLPLGKDGNNRWKHSLTGLHLAVANGLIVTASSETLLDASLAHLGNGTGIDRDARFMQVRNSSGKNVQMNLYLRLSDSIISEHSLWRQVGDWLVLDVTTRPEGPVMNGFAHSLDSTSHLINLFRDSPPQPIRFAPAIPADVSAFLMFAVKDVAQWHDQLRSWDSETGLLHDSLKNSTGEDIAAHFIPWMSGQFGTCRLPMRDGSVETFALFESGNNELADQLLSSLTERMGGDTSARDIPNSRILSVMMGPVAPALATPHYLRVNNHVIIGNSTTALEIYAHHLRADRTLSTDIAFTAFSEQFSSSYNVFSFQKLPLETSQLKSGLTSVGDSVLTDIGRLFDSFPAFGVQLSNAGGTFYVNMHWRHDPDWQSRPSEEAAARTDAPVTMRPVWVRNHLSGEPELLVQDRDNTLYLFNRTGQELFKRNLPESIVGRPVQVDRFKNGNLQYVFSTNNFIYLIDRNGKDVEGFPVELESPVSVPMLVVNYDGKHNYRLIVPCRNLRVYNYGIDGKKVKGWKLDRTSTEAGTSMAHLSHGKKDYLSMIETGGKAHLLDRTGARRATIKDSISRSFETALFAFATKDQKAAGFYLSDPEGTVLHITLQGDVDVISLGRFTPEHRYLLADLDNDGKPEHIFLDLNTLKVFGPDKQIIFKRRISHSISRPHIITSPDGRSFIALSDSDNNNLLLLNSSGEPVDGFPLIGSGPFNVLFEDQGKLLVAESTENGLRISTIE